MYLQKAQIQELLRDLRAVFPRHRLICDLGTRKFLEKYDRTTRDKIEQLGAPFKFAMDRPQELFEQQGYRLTEQISIAEKSVEFGALDLPRFLLRTWMPIAVTGYSICLFDL